MRKTILIASFLLASLSFGEVGEQTGARSHVGTLPVNRPHTGLDPRYLTEEDIERINTAVTQGVISTWETVMGYVQKVGEKNPKLKTGMYSRLRKIDPMVFPRGEMLIGPAYPRKAFYGRVGEATTFGRIQDLMKSKVKLEEFLNQLKSLTNEEAKELKDLEEIDDSK